MMTTLILIGLLFIVLVAFINFYPSFGGNSTKKQQLCYEQSNQFNNRKYRNTSPVPIDLSFFETLSLAYKFFTIKVPNGRSKENLQAQKIDLINVPDYNGKARMIWFGHSSFLLQVDRKNILIDPIFGNVPAPHPLLGENRFNKEFPLEIEKLPQIDAVIYSHNHYDHLDYESVLKIKNKTRHFYTPLGVGNHLKAWGIPDAKITEMNWWQEAKFETLKLACTPAQHFSGRNINNSQSTLWSS